MPKANDRARRERRRAEEQLAQSYGWPSPRRRRHLGLVSGVIVGYAAIGAVVFVLGCFVAALLGWRP